MFESVLQPLLLCVFQYKTTRFGKEFVLRALSVQRCRLSDKAKQSNRFSSSEKCNRAYCSRNHELQNKAAATFFSGSVLSISTNYEMGSNEISTVQYRGRNSALYLRTASSPWWGCADAEAKEGIAVTAECSAGTVQGRS